MNPNALYWWRRGESNPRPKSPALRRTTYLADSGLVSQKALRIGKRKLSASLIDLAGNPQAVDSAASPLNDASHPFCGPDGGDALLYLSSESKLRVGSCVKSILLRADGPRYAFSAQSLPSKPERPLSFFSLLWAQRDVKAGRGPPSPAQVRSDRLVGKRVS